MFPVHTILHPTDFTECSQHARELAYALARDYGARLVLLHVFPTPVIPDFGGGAYPMPLEVPRQKLLEDLRKITPEDAPFVVERVLEEGDPAQDILRVAKAYDCDLIVMGTHGRGGLSRLLMGSVAEAVSRKADCPVLTVRPKTCESGTKHAEIAHQESEGDTLTPACPHALGR